MNWPPWPRLLGGLSRDSGTVIIEVLIALAVTGLISTILLSTIIFQLHAYGATTAKSEALQNAWTAILWLRRDLQGARKIVKADSQGLVILETPYISGPDFSRLRWRQIEYFLKASERQLQRSIYGSHNIVAENVVNFTFSLDHNKNIATVSITTKRGEETAQFSTKVWLRNMR